MRIVYPDGTVLVGYARPGELEHSLRQRMLVHEVAERASGSLLAHSMADSEGIGTVPRPGLAGSEFVINAEAEFPPVVDGGYLIVKRGSRLVSHDVLYRGNGDAGKWLPVSNLRVMDDFREVLSALLDDAHRVVSGPAVFLGDSFRVGAD